MFGELLEDLATWSPEALRREYEQLELRRRELEARSLAVLAVLDVRGVGGADGHRSTTAYLRATTNQSRAQASVRRARLVGDHPAVGEALMAGRFGLSQVDQIARVHANPRVTEFFTPQAVDWFTRRAEHRPLREFAADVDNWLAAADQDGAFREEQAAVEARDAHVVAAEGVGIDVAASGGDTLTAEELVNTFRAFVDDEVARDVAARKREHGRADRFPLARSVKQRRYDALVQIFRSAAAWRAAGKGRAPAAEPVVNVVCDQSSFHDLLRTSGLTLADGDPLDIDLDELSRRQLQRLMADLTADPDQAFTRRIRTESGRAVHPQHLLRAVLTGWVRRVLIDRRSVVVDMSARARCFTGAARTAAVLLHDTCVHQGCEVPAHRCQVDHNDEHHAGGATTQENGQPICPPHNRFKHRERWRTRRADNGRTYNIRPDGSVVLSVGASPPTFVDDELRELRGLDYLDQWRQQLQAEVA